jgi:ureidoglycolate hydrolase
MEQIVSVKLQPLQAEAFRPYGSVLELKNPVFPDVEDGKPVMLMIRVKRAANNRRLEQLAIHFSYNQTFIPLKGSMALVVAPPPRNRDAGPEGYELDYDRLAAFVMEPGDAALVDKGTWHTIVALGEECVAISGTRKGAERSDKGIVEIEGGKIPVSYDQLAKQSASFIEFVDLKKRDNRVMELEL